MLPSSILTRSCLHTSLKELQLQRTEVSHGTHPALRPSKYKRSTHPPTPNSTVISDKTNTSSSSPDRTQDVSLPGHCSVGQCQLASPRDSFPSPSKFGRETCRVRHEGLVKMDRLRARSASLRTMTHLQDSCPLTSTPRNLKESLL